MNCCACVFFVKFKNLKTGAVVRRCTNKNSPNFYQHVCEEDSCIFAKNWKGENGDKKELF